MGGTTGHGVKQHKPDIERQIILHFENSYIETRSKQNKEKEKML